jgi:hypothetical protein
LRGSCGEAPAHLGGQDAQLSKVAIRRGVVDARAARSQLLRANAKCRAPNGMNSVGYGGPLFIGNCAIEPI